MLSFFRFCVVAILLALAGQAAAQNLYVIAARGNVKSQKTGKNLHPGDVIPSDDIITFRDVDDLISLISEEGQRFVVAYPLKRYKPKKATYPLDFVRQQGAVGVFPIDPTFYTIEDAKLFFSGRPFVFLGPETRLKVPKKVFPMSRALFFYINYDYKEDNIDKKIDYKGDSVVFVKRNIFKIDGKEVDGKYAENFKFYYYNQPKNKHTFLGKMRPYWPVDERLKEETDVLVTRLQQKNATPEAIVKELAGFLNQHYGTMVSEDFSQWLHETYPNLDPGAVTARAAAQTEFDAAKAALDSAAAAAAAAKASAKGAKSR